MAYQNIIASSQGVASHLDPYGISSSHIISVSYRMTHDIISYRGNIYLPYGIISCSIVVCHIIHHVIWYDIVSYGIMLYHVYRISYHTISKLSHHIMPYRTLSIWYFNIFNISYQYTVWIMWYHTVSCHTVSYSMISYNIIAYHIMLCHIISCFRSVTIVYHCPNSVN